MAIRFLSNESIDGTLIVSKPATGSVEIAKFKVDGTGGTTGNLSYVSIIPGSSNFATQLRLHTNALGTYQSISNISGVLTLATNDSNPMEFKTNSVTRLTISNTGAATFTGLVSGITPTAAANFVTKAYADGLTPGSGVFLPLAGGTMGGNIDMNSYEITELDSIYFGYAANISGGPSSINITSGNLDVTGGNATVSGNVTVGGTAVDAAGTGSIKSNGIIRSVLASGTADSTIINAISGVSNGFQLSNDASNNQEYIFHNGGTQSLKIDSSGNSTFAGNILVGNTVVNPASGFSDQTGIGLKYSTTVPTIEVSSDSAAMQLGRSSTGGEGQILGLRKAGTIIHNFDTNNVSIGTNATFAGDVGIGTTSFNHFSNAKELLIIGDAVNTNSVVQVISNDNNSSLAIYSGESSTDNPAIIYQNDLRFGSTTDVGLGGYTERMRINSSGDVGIGTTPETAGATWRTLFIGASATIVSRQAAGGYDSIFANNYYVNSSNQDRVRTTGPSSRMFLDGNNIRFQISPSTGAGGAPSWSEIMRIDANGYVGIGTTSPTTPLNVAGNLLVSTTVVDGQEDRFKVVGGGAADAATVTVHNASETATITMTGVDGRIAAGNISAATFVEATTLMYTSNGVEGAPSYTFSSDPNTGMYRPSADTISFTTGGSNRLTIDSSGDISQPVTLGAKLHSPAGNVTYPTYGFVGHTGRGMMMSNATTLNIVQAGFAQIKLRSTINTAYVSDGLWGTNATPNIIKSAAGLGMYFGYQDNGSGLYAAAYGFLTKSVDGLNNPSSREVLQLKDNDTQQVNWTVTNLGAVTARGSITSNGSPSDKRLKENIKPIDCALTKINKLQGISFDWKEDASILDEKEDYGFIAQDVQKVLPEIIKEDAVGMLSMRYNSVIPILVESVKELEKVVNDLKKEIIELKK